MLLPDEVIITVQDYVFKKNEDNDLFNHIV